MFFSQPKQSVKTYLEQKYHENIRPTRASLKSQSQAGLSFLLILRIRLIEICNLLRITAYHSD